MNHHRPHFPMQRPSWWPENEPWPPKRGQFRRYPFFRRLGCAFGLFNLLVFVVFLFGLAYIAKLLGITQIPFTAVLWAIPLGIGLVIFLVMVIFAGLFAMRRILLPLDDLLEAAGHVAEGDYSIRVPETGPKAVRQLSQAFNNMASRLHQTDEKRRQLLADVTHELRTPLTVIQGNLEGMLDGIYPADEANLKALLDETGLLSRLMDELRTLALAESGALQLKKEPTDLETLLQETRIAFQAPAEAAGVALTVEVVAALPTLEIDPGRIRQVLANLLTNALRYTPANGRIILRGQVEAENVILEVQDTGPGIPAQDLPHIFERFYKSTDSGGMGLGLAIARHLVEAHGGHIAAENAPGGGTLIRIWLPVTV
jgi:signal transduction histidine kinase